MNREEEFSDEDNRKDSLEGLEFGSELATVGAYKDKFKTMNLISCFKCGLVFKVQEILEFSVLKKLTFLQSSWLYHSRSNPTCEFLKSKVGK